MKLGENWTKFDVNYCRILYVSIDSNEADVGPKQDYRPYVFFYYFVYLIIIAFFMINIFVGFVIVTFQSEGEASFQDCALDKNQVRRSRLFITSLQTLSFSVTVLNLPLMPNQCEDTFQKIHYNTGCGRLQLRHSVNIPFL